MKEKDNKNEPKLTQFQLKCVEAIRKSRNQMAALDEIAARLRTNRLAVYSAMWSLRERGLAHYFRSGDDQWAIQIWALAGKLKEV